MFKKAVFIFTVFLIFASTINAQNSNNEFISIVKQYFDKGNYKATINQLNFFIKKHKESPSVIDAFFKIGESYEKLKEYQKAIDTYKIISDRYPDTAHEKNALFISAYIYRNVLKKYDIAYSFYLKLKTKYLKTKYIKSVLMSLISLCEKLNKNSEAIDFINLLLKKYPSSKSFRLYYLPLKADFYLKTGNKKKAILSYKQLINYFKSIPDVAAAKYYSRLLYAYKIIGRLYQETGRISEASDYFFEESGQAKNIKLKTGLLYNAAVYSYKAKNYKKSALLLKGLIKASPFVSDTATKSAYLIYKCFKNTGNSNRSYYWLLSASLRGNSNASKKIKGLHFRLKKLIENKEYKKSYMMLIYSSALFETIKSGRNMGKIKNREDILFGLYLLSKSLIGLNNKNGAKKILSEIIQIGQNEKTADNARKLLKRLN
jgi:tetratricopeptide (TPR) repeat protein